MTNNKSPGLDDIPADLLKHGMETFSEQLANLFSKMWRVEKLPQDWNKGVIIKLPKKGSLCDCNNWRGITLLSSTGKIFSKILLNRLQNAVDITLREQQA